jgi:predicted aspartyl protease
MGRIVASVVVENPSAPEKKIHCDALVDTGASHMILPAAWKDRLGPLEEVGRVEFETATQRTTEGIVCGPVRLRIEGFRPVFTEVVFIQMEPEDGDYEPLIGYIVLEQSQAAVDTLGHRLVHVKRLDLKFCSAVRRTVATA